jgi:hypothetical protein
MEDSFPQGEAILRDRCNMGENADVIALAAEGAPVYSCNPPFQVNFGKIPQRSSDLAWEYLDVLPPGPMRRFASFTYHASAASKVTGFQGGPYLARRFSTCCLRRLKSFSSTPQTVLWLILA